MRVVRKFAWERTPERVPNTRQAPPSGSELKNTVKSSNFVILLSENIFFHQTFFILPHNFFWYWSLYSWGLWILLRQFWPRPRNFVFRRVKNEIRRPSINFVTLLSYMGYNDDFKERILMTWHFILWKQILWNHTKRMTPCMGLYANFYYIYKRNK
jgi:hypothetical protein